MASYTVDKIGSGMFSEYWLTVLDTQDEEVHSQPFLTKHAAQAMGEQWLPLANAISDYKLACAAIDKAYTDDQADNCRIYAQAKHDAAEAIALSMGITNIDLSI